MNQNRFVLGIGNLQLSQIRPHGLTLAGDSASLRHAVAALTVATFITGMLFLLARRWIKPGITEPVAC